MSHLRHRKVMRQTKLQGSECALTDTEDVLQTLLTLKYVEQKVGLAGVVLAAAVQFSAILLRWNYHPIKYQHATNPTDNTRRRHHMFNQLRVQTDEHVLTYEKGAQQVLTWSGGGGEHQSRVPVTFPCLLSISSADFCIPLTVCLCGSTQCAGPSYSTCP